ncbi:MAG: BON domain-containing protein [Armatimonadota bacterium]|nr:BON domain-containing protein [bacterium]
MVTQGDRDIEERLTRALSKDSRIDLSEITVRVDEGVVYLTGTVDSAAERQAAQEDIYAAASVRQVVDQLRLRNYIERTDEELRESVKQVLVRDIDLDARPISVEASNGVVILSGCVASYAQKSEAETIAWWTPGVTDVVSHLEVDSIPEPIDELEF